MNTESMDEWDEWDEYEEDGPMDLEDQLDAAFARADRKKNAYRPSPDELERSQQFDDRLAMFRAEY